MNNFRSLYIILGIIVTSVVVTVMSILLTYNYFTTKTHLTNELKNKSEISLNRITNSISPFIESYSMNDYEKLLINEMNDKTIIAIIVNDYNAANILGKENFHNGKIRDNKWNTITYQINNTKHNNDIKTSYLDVSNVILSSNSKKIGTVSIYYTDIFLKKELDLLIEKSLITVFVVSFILIGILFITINRLVFQPIQRIMQTLSTQDQQGIPINNIECKASKEFMLLSSVINNMLSTIKCSQKEINNLNERFQLTLDSVDDGMWDWNIVTDEAHLSIKWKSMLGYLENDLENTGQTFFKLLHEDDKKHVDEIMQKHFEDPINNKYNLKIRLKCKDGSFKWIQTRGKVLLDHNKNPIRMVGFQTDITSEKQQETHMKQKDRQISEQSKLVSMGEMIGNIAHQWRQPLSVISTGSTGMKMQNEYNLLTTEIINKTCDMINNNAQYLSNTIDDFRNFVKGDREKTIFNLTNDINSFLHLVEGTIKKNDIKVTLNLDDHISIHGYENELIQCLINIFNNSKDALIESQIEKKLIFIETHTVNNDAVITIKDNGGGIPQDVLPRIFEPYFTTKHTSQGTGLGLHMTYNLIVDGMHGKIETSNTNYEYQHTEYSGAKFIITLPLS